MWILIALVVGALIGYVSSRYWRAVQGRQFDNILIGMIGAFLGNRLFESIGGHMGDEVTQNMNLQLATAAGGAILLVVAIRVIRRKPKLEEDGTDR